MVADVFFGIPDGLIEAVVFLLADVLDCGGPGDLGPALEAVLHAGRPELPFEFVGLVGGAFDRLLAAASDRGDLVDVGFDGLLDDVLDGRLVEDAYRLLRLGLRDREE